MNNFQTATAGWTNEEQSPSRYVGLNFTPASHFQIFRGSLIIFTGLLRVICFFLFFPSFDLIIWTGFARVLVWWLICWPISSWRWSGWGKALNGTSGWEWYLNHPKSLNEWRYLFVSVKVVILAGLGIVAVGSFPPFAEEICNRFSRKKILRRCDETLCTVQLQRDRPIPNGSLPHHWNLRHLYERQRHPAHVHRREWRLCEGHGRVQGGHAHRCRPSCYGCSGCLWGEGKRLDTSRSMSLSPGVSAVQRPPPASSCLGGHMGYFSSTFFAPIYIYPFIRFLHSHH